MTDITRSDQSGYTTDTYKGFDETISGANVKAEPLAARTPPADPPQTSHPIGILLKIQRFISEHHRKVSEYAVIATVIIGVVTVTQTNRQLQTNQSNFQTEMEIQTRSTSALLFSDYINKIEPTDLTRDNLDSHRQTIIGAQTEFMLNGVSHDDLRGQILSFLGATQLSSLLSTKMRENGKFQSLISLAGMSFENSKISGRFEGGNFSSVSFRNSTLQDVQALKGTFYYTDLRGSNILGGNFTKAQFNCTSLAAANFKIAVPIFHNTTFRDVDLRDIKISGDIVTESSYPDSNTLLANILSTATLQGVIVSDAVFESLRNLNKKGMLSSSSQLPPDEWFEMARDKETCSGKFADAQAGEPSHTIAANANSFLNSQ